MAPIPRAIPSTAAQPPRGHRRPRGATMVDLHRDACACTRAAVAASRWSLGRAQIVFARRACSARTSHIDALAAQVELGAGEPEHAVELAEHALLSAGPTDYAVQCEALEVLGRMARLRNIDRA